MVVGHDFPAACQQSAVSAVPLCLVLFRSRLSPMNMISKASTTIPCRCERRSKRRHFGAVVVAALCATTFPAQAQWHVVLHTFSYHFQAPTKGRWNEENWGLGLRRDLGETTALQVGAYNNSSFNTSAYIMGEWLPVGVGPIRAGVFGGGVSGYKLPMGAGLAGRAQFGHYSATVRLVPKVYKSGSAALSLELAYRF